MRVRIGGEDGNRESKRAPARRRGRDSRSGTVHYTEAGTGAAPWEQDRLSTRFHEIRERLRTECWGHWREED